LGERGLREGKGEEEGRRSPQTKLYHYTNDCDAAAAAAGGVQMVCQASSCVQRDGSTATVWRRS